MPIDTEPDITPQIIDGKLFYVNISTGAKALSPQELGVTGSRVHTILTRGKNLRESYEYKTYGKSSGLPDYTKTQTQEVIKNPLSPTGYTNKDNVSVSPPNQTQAEAYTKAGLKPVVGNQGQIVSFTAPNDPYVYSSIDEYIAKQKDIAKYTPIIKNIPRESNLSPYAEVLLTKTYFNPLTGKEFTSPEELNIYLRQHNIPISKEGEGLSGARIIDIGAGNDTFTSFELKQAEALKLTAGENLPVGFQRLRETSERAREMALKTPVAQAIQSGINIIGEGFERISPISTQVREEVIASRYGQAMEKTIQDTKNVYNIANKEIKEHITEPILTSSFMETVFRPEALPIYYMSFGKPVAEFSSSFLKGIAEDIRDDPLKNIILFGAGGLMGATYRGGEMLLSGLGRGAVMTYKAGVLGFGAYATGSAIKESIDQSIQAETKEQSAKILGVALKDLALIGYGFQKGEKGYDIVSGKLATLGRERIDLEKGIYPEAPKSKQLELFRKNILEGLSFKPLDKIKLAKEYAEFNLLNQLKLKEASQFPRQHAYPHLKEVAINVQKLIDVYPEFQPYLIREYGSIANAKAEISKGGFIHDLLKLQSSSANEYFGKGHGEIFYDLYKTGNLPAGIELKPKVAKAIKIHEVTEPLVPSVEFKILSTADRLDFVRFSQGVKKEYLPLKDAMERISKIPEEVQKMYEVPKIDFNKDTSNFLKKYKIISGKIVPLEAKPVALHTTAQYSKLTSKGIITPEAGKSELPVLYVSTKLSTPFTGITSESITSKLFENFKRNVMNLIEPRGKAGVLALQPKSFKQAVIGFSENPTFEGQRPIKGKYAYFKTPAEKGVLEVIGLKSEIEAGARKEAGDWKINQKQFYDVVEGVRIPVDRAIPIETKDFQIKIMKDINKDVLIKQAELKKAVEFKTPAEKPLTSASKLFEQVRGNNEKGITWSEMTSQGRDMIMQTIELQATHEVRMFVTTKETLEGIKFTKVQIEKLKDARFNKLLDEYKQSLEKKSTVIELKQTIEQPKFEMYAEYVSPKKTEGLLSSGYKSMKSEISSMYKSMSRSISSSESPTSYSLKSSGVSSSISPYPSPSPSPYPSKSSSKVSSEVSPYPYKYPSPYPSKSIYPISYKEKIPEKILSISKEFPSIEPKKKKSLGTGYNVFGKALKSNKFFKINSHPLTKDRAKDIGSYYVANTLARTFKIEKTGRDAEEDYQFAYIPYGYFESKSGTLREYKIKQRQKLETPEQFIQKSIFALSSEGEKSQIKAFQKQARSILR